MFEDDDERTYQVVVNDEEQYSIWLADRELPAGWREAGREGTKVEVLAWIDEVWTEVLGAEKYGQAREAGVV